MEPTKILISGGWGYANFGDDAILLSTYQLVRKKFPQSEITIMSYNCIETRGISGLKDVRVVPSIHRMLVGERMFSQFDIITSPASLYTPTLGWLGKLSAKFKREYHKIFERRSDMEYENLKSRIKETAIFREFEKADLFILAGGGYFNGTWRSNLFAHALEIESAKSCGARVLFIGQSIGPFPDQLTLETAKTAFTNCTSIYVRDTYSYEDLFNFGFHPRMIPDTALAHNLLSEKKQQIIVVLGGGGMTSVKIGILAAALLTASSTHGMEIKIMVTRSWKADVFIARQLYEALKEQVTNLQMVIPKDYDEAQKELLGGTVIVSQNLHGLIMGWRAGGTCISLSYGRKFISFMEQSEQSDRIVTEENFNAQVIAVMITQALEAVENSKAVRSRLAEHVADIYFQALDEVCERA